MVRRNFSEYIKELEKDVTRMSEMVISAVNRSIAALKARDINSANRIIAEDELINKMRWETEEKCIQLIALQQPVASDLREIVAVMNIITDLERMGDYAEGIAKIVVMLGDEPPVKPLVDIPVMAEKAADMIKRSIDAFVRRDAETAKAICREDDQVDEVYERVYSNLINIMVKDPTLIMKATRLIWASHNVERIADRVTNICERTVFLVTGKMQKVDVSRY